MTSSRNVEDVVLFLKKQLQKTQEQVFEKVTSSSAQPSTTDHRSFPQSAEYRQLLIQSIHVTAIKFSEVAGSVVNALIEFLGDSNNPSALDVVAFARQVSFIVLSHSFLIATSSGR